MPKRESKTLQGEREQPNTEFLRRSSLTYLECCISLMLTHMPREEVTTVLEREAQMLRELG